MANTLLGQPQYTYGTLQQTAQTSGNAGSLQYATWPNNATITQPYYVYSPGLSEAEKAGKAIAILKELQAEGLINIDSVEKFCEMIDKIANKI